jgi:hypothetical protein
MSIAQDRLEAVAQALANVKYPISVDPQAQEADRTEAEKFLAMWDAARRFPVSPLRHRIGEDPDMQLEF